MFGAKILLVVIIVVVVECQSPDDFETDKGTKKGSWNVTIDQLNEKERAFATAFLNFGTKKHKNFQRGNINIKTKVELLSKLLKIHVDHLREKSDQIELVFLIDASGSVGIENFRSELSFVRKLLSDFTVTASKTRVAVITFADKTSIIRHIDQISKPEENNHKCRLLNQQLENVNYTGGGTYTRGALLEALDILQRSRSEARKAVFLITDGFSNGGDPRPAAMLLKETGATIFTFGIQTGNVEELHDIASQPGYTHSYLLDSFAQFEALARRALHHDLKAGTYVIVNSLQDCDSLCHVNPMNENAHECCDVQASCACGITSGHYACLCPPGYFGSGFYNTCQPCPNGTYGLGVVPGDLNSACIECPDTNHITLKEPATTIKDCICASGYTTEGDKCSAVTCPKLTIPKNGYLVKASACNNVVNAACGIRCKIGFHLTGDSIRLCRKDGAWSGTKTECLLKTCLALQAPSHGLIRCENEDSKQPLSPGLIAFAIDTNCKFKCDIGYQLRGSRSRNCLPLSRWDGLKTTCKPIRCQPLKIVANGEMTPDYCTGIDKLPFGTNCTLQCKPGFVVKGPVSKICAGHSGSWTQRHSTAQCIDETPPEIKCHEDMTFVALPGQNYALADWPDITATDNSDIEPMLWTEPHVTKPWKLEIGNHTITYIARDASRNEANCSFSIEVLDKESPTVENCVDPPIFLLEGSDGAKNVTWDEPVFHDNSGLVIETYRSHVPGEGIFKLGTTKVVYHVTDHSNNTNSCVLNVTVEDACQNFPKLVNGSTECTDLGNGVRCALTCNDGYAFILPESTIHPAEDNLTLTCSIENHSWNNNVFPDCSITEIPYALAQDVIIVLNSNETHCKDSIVEKVKKNINLGLEYQLASVCGNNSVCNISQREITCVIQSGENSDNTQYETVVSVHEKERRSISPRFAHLRQGDGRIQHRKKRNSAQGKKKFKSVQHRRTKIELKYKVIGKLIRDSKNNSEEDMAKLRGKLTEMSENGQLGLLDEKANQEISNFTSNIDVMVKKPKSLCHVGSVLKKSICVACPPGTFHNATRRHCQSCPFGKYQGIAGSTSCLQCPENMSTRKMRSKNMTDCIAVCRPGYFSSRKRHVKAKLALEPCVTCKIGTYQSDFAQTKCLPCPVNTTTINRGAHNSSQCVDMTSLTKHPCDSNPCNHEGICIKIGKHSKCQCKGNFIGTTCDILPNPCNSSPCLNNGICSIENVQDEFEVKCFCPEGYTGPRCEMYIDECTINPCKNDGICVSSDDHFKCLCKDGFEGELCEIAIDHCAISPCEEGSTCRVSNGTWQCICEPGYMGRRCNRLPCDWLPCHSNSNCVNVRVVNATKMAYRCECPEGYTGKDCKTRIDHCKSLPCLNNANCVNHLLNYTCECRPGFSGLNCQRELSTSYIMNFPKSGTTDYVLINGPKKNFSEFTVCLWLQSVDTINYGTVLSYATSHCDNALTLTDYNGFVLYVNGKSVVTDITANDGYWHFLCVNWESSLGSWKVFLDGIVRENGTGLANGTEIEGNGTMVIGQEQDHVGGGFSESESLVGKLSLLDVWDEVLSDDSIRNISEICESYHGSLYNWGQFQDHIRGSIELQNSSFCQACSLPDEPFTGNMALIENSSEIRYTCNEGYLVRYGQKETVVLKRKCLKHGAWEGYYTPTCIRVKCGFLGYFPRGRVWGKSYSYGDQIHYVCSEGYVLRGNSQRTCLANGHWSGEQPMCIGTECRELLAPDNGSIKYITEEHESIDKLILQVGHQLEFECNSGYRLFGNSILTCLQTGEWENPVPECISFGCSPPKLIENGYIAAKISSVIDAVLRPYDSSHTESVSDEASVETEYNSGDVVGIACYPGYKFIGNRNLIAEFRIQCTTEGVWDGLVPNCVPLHCPRPENVKNAKIYLSTDDNELLEIGGHDNPETVSWRDISTSNDNETTKTSTIPDNEENFSRITSTESFVLGTRISIICNEGYQLIGSSVRECTSNETWSSTVPYCKIKECDVQKHPFLSLLDNSEAEMYFKDNVNISPKLGSIQTLRETHVVRGKTMQLTFIRMGTGFGDTISISCYNDTTVHLDKYGIDIFLKNISWICDKSGEWRLINKDVDDEEIRLLMIEKKTAICEKRTCYPPKVPLNGFIVNGSSKATPREIDDVITFRCHRGYELRGIENVKCLADGTWTLVPTCEPTTCGRLPTPPNAAFLFSNSNNTERYVFGDTVWYRCNPGYRLSGPANARCLATGRWTRLVGMCSRMFCGKPTLVEGASIVGQSYFYQDRITYVCPDKNIQATANCTSDGKWTGLPDCTANFKA